MANPYLEDILYAASFAKDVQLNMSKIEERAVAWADEEFPIPDWRMPVFPEADDDTFVQFLGIGNALNYCFSDPKTGLKYETEYLGKSWRGAFGMWAALKRALDEGKPILDPGFLTELSFEETDKLFTGLPSLPMLEERHACLRWVGYTLLGGLPGSYAELFRQCGYQAFNNGEGIVEQLAYYDPFFDDSEYCFSTRKDLCFHKRANLFVMMYHGRALSSNGALPLIKDANDLTPPADYEVPKALRHLGILEYSPELAGWIDSGKELPSDSREEREIRTQTVAAMHALCRLLPRKSIAALDFKVWSEGKASDKPHHLTETYKY